MVLISFASCLSICSLTIAASSAQAIAPVWALTTRKQPLLGCNKCPFPCPFRPAFGDLSPLLLFPVASPSFHLFTLLLILVVKCFKYLNVSCLPVRFLTNMSKYKMTQCCILDLQKQLKKIRDKKWEECRKGGIGSNNEDSNMPKRILKYSSK